MCNFDIDFTGRNINELITLAKTEIEKNGGTFDGNERAGSFSTSSPKVIGNYTVELNVIHFTITKKPIIASCGLIEKKLREYLGS